MRKYFVECQIKPFGVKVRLSSLSPLWFPNSRINLVIAAQSGLLMSRIFNVSISISRFEFENSRDSKENEIIRLEPNFRSPEMSFKHMKNFSR